MHTQLSFSINRCCRIHKQKSAHIFHSPSKWDTKLYTQKCTHIFHSPSKWDTKLYTQKCTHIFHSPSKWDTKLYTQKCTHSFHFASKWDTKFTHLSLAIKMRQNSYASFILHQNKKQNSFFAKVANPFHKFQSIQAVNLFKSIKKRHFVVLAEEIN